VAGTPERTAVLEAARALIEVARRNGYRREELVAIIERMP
jgi:hypothetical protein